jgi:mRNA interferase RelE/StbE
MKPLYRLRVPDDAVRLIRGLHPELKQKVRTALDLLGQDANAGKALQAELEGLRSLRIGRFRLVYRVSGRRVIEIVALGPRERIYEETLRLLSRTAARGKA